MAIVSKLDREGELEGILLRKSGFYSGFEKQKRTEKPGVKTGNVGEAKESRKEASSVKELEDTILITIRPAKLVAHVG